MTEATTQGAQADLTGAGRPNLLDAWVLPEVGDALRLVEADFVTAATDLGVEVAAVHAVAEVESGGRTGFDAQKRPKILFEIHLFREHTSARYDTTHPKLSAPYSHKKARRASYARDQWVVIREAFALDKAAAVKSASWGMFQVLGSNAFDCGWTTLQHFVTDMFSSEGQHMRAFLGFCRANNLVRYLKTHQWASFASAYNGPSYADNAYDTKMASAYARWSGQSVGAHKKGKHRKRKHA
ncbi:MAG: N-acetylmuramidase family protein [Minicystis sp.]